MTHAENKLKWCLRKAEKEGIKHRGIKQITPNLHKAYDHIKKAEHNLMVMEYLMREKFNDWAIPAAFYSQYHCLLAILQKFGYESRNQECTFATTEYLIEQEKINLAKETLHKIFDFDIHEKLVDAADIVDLRERFQYGTETMVQEQKIKELLRETKNFIEKTKTILQT